MSLSEFIELPDLVIRNILTYLDGVDLLKLRRVCKKIKSWIENLDVNEKWNKYQITFQEVEDFEKYAKSGLQIPNIKTSHPSYWGKSKWKDVPFLSEFCSKCGPLIKSLRIEIYMGCVEDEEFKFYSSLSNLEELKIDYFSSPTTSGDRFPPNFQNLKILKIKFIKEGTSQLKFFELMRFCCKTESLWIPYPPIPDDWALPFIDFNLFQANPNHLMDLINDRERQGQSAEGTSKIKNIYLNELMTWNYSGTTRNFLQFVEYCFQQEIKLFKVKATLLNEFSELEPRMGTDALDQTVVSLIGFTSNCLLFGWDNLKSLSSGSCWDHQYIPLDFDPPIFPKLRSLTFDFDSDFLNDPLDQRKHEEFLFKVFFPKNPKESRNEVDHFVLKDSFERNKEKRIHLGDYDVSRIVDCVPHLKSLVIKRWQGNQNEFGTLFSHLPMLEELVIHKCPGFTDQMLIGNDPKDPVFLRLTQLKKLTLDCGPGLTNLALKEILSKMNLTDLKLWRTDYRFKLNITSAGISALAKGLFGSSIKKFFCEGFSLEDVTRKFQSELKFFPLPASSKKSQAQKGTSKKKQKTKVATGKKEHKKENESESTSSEESESTSSEKKSDTLPVQRRSKRKRKAARKEPSVAPARVEHPRKAKVKPTVLPAAFPRMATRSTPSTRM